MKEKEEQLAEEVEELLRRAQEVDEEEDRRYGQDRRGDELPEELPEELAFRESRLRKIREAKAALEAEAWAAEQATAEGKEQGKEHQGFPGTRRSGTSPAPTPASCPALEAGTSSRRTTARRWWTAPTR